MRRLTRKEKPRLRSSSNSDADNETYLWSGVFGDLASDDQISVAQLVHEGGTMATSEAHCGAGRYPALG